MKNLKNFWVKTILRKSRTEMWVILFIYGGIMAIDRWEYVLFLLEFLIKLVTFKNYIDIRPNYGLKSIKFGAYAQIWSYGFWLITQPFFVPYIKNLLISSKDH